MNNDTDATFPQRRTIIDINNTYNRKKHRHKKRQQFNKFVYDDSTDDEQQDNADPIPLELRPIILAAIGYGKHTYALGAMKAATTLKQVVNELRLIINNNHNYDNNRELLLSLVSLVERESHVLSELFAKTYNGETQD